MKNYLIDTCCLIWALERNETKLGANLDIIINPRNIIFVSIVSYWEIVIKQSLGKLKVPSDLKIQIKENGFISLNLKMEHIDELSNLPNIHNDPFDRLIISQAKSDNLKIITTDNKILQYF